MGHTISTVLDSMQGLTQAVSEARHAAELGSSLDDDAHAAPTRAPAELDTALAPRLAAAPAPGIAAVGGGFVAGHANADVDAHSSAGGAARADRADRGDGTRGDRGGHAAAWAHGRLRQMEARLHGQLEYAGQVLGDAERQLSEQFGEGPHAPTTDGSQQPLVVHNVEVRDAKLKPPTASAVLDGAAEHYLQAEVHSLESQLAITRRELKDVIRTKAYKYELAFMRNELHSFLFGGVAPPFRPGNLSLLDAAAYTDADLSSTPHSATVSPPLPPAALG